MEEKKQIRRSVLCFMLLFAACTAVCAVWNETASVTVGSWGLKFQENGQPPVGNAGISALAAYDAVYVGDPDEKTLYLTFDAGYENGCVPQILDTLNAHQVPAAFFLVGDYLEMRPDLVLRMAQEGHTVANHTWTHGNMSKLTDKEAFRQELEQVEALYKEITGREMKKFYRPPKGEYSQENLELAKELGYKTVFWSLSYVDWDNNAQPTADTAFEKLLPRTHNGAIILLHATSKTNAAILDELLTRWEDMGYTFAPIETLFEK